MKQAHGDWICFLGADDWFCNMPVPVHYRHEAEQISGDENEADKSLCFFQDKKAGVIEKIPTGYRFQYFSEYLSLPEALPVSLTLRLSLMKAKPFFLSLQGFSRKAGSLIFFVKP